MRPEEAMERHLELAADEAMQGLCPDDWQEFRTVEPNGEQRRQVIEEMELIAASIAEAHCELSEMPASLEQRLQRSVGVVSAVSRPQPQSQEAAEEAAAPQGRVEPIAGRTEPPKRTSHVDPWKWTGWAAAAIVVLVWTMNPGPKPQPPEVRGPVERLDPPKTDVAPPTDTKEGEGPGESKAESPGDASVPPAQQRAKLLEHEATRRFEWTATQDPAAQGVSGNVVWNPQVQTGYMAFEGLAKNDPGEQQYQLWIFDEERDTAHPVDGGVFDVDESGHVIVPIDPKLPIHDATLFAVTVERPGGVVVSDRERIVVTAEAS